MRNLVSIAVSFSLVAQTALAVPAVTTANVNFRQGPGTGFQSFGTLPANTQVDLEDCDDNGAWCAVSSNGQTGFVSGNYLKLIEEEKESGWPRSFQTGNGATLILYQPQISAWENFKRLEGVVAAEYIKDTQSKPVFGVIALAGDTQPDPEKQEVIVSGLRVTELNFSSLDRDSLTDLTLEVGKLMPTGSITMKETRITASLAEYTRMEDVDGLNAEAPPIFVTNEPAILVQTDGEPVEAPVKGVTGLSFVINTNWDLLKVDETATYYLRDGEAWLSSRDLAADWSPVATLPDLVTAVPDDDNWKETRTAIPAKSFPDGIVPKVVYSDRPAEMISFDGDPVFEDVPNTALEWASNTESDVFRLKSDGTWYILVSGRWFKSASLDGPWVFTTPDLPADFLNIPEDAPYYSVRASVPNTSEAEQARLKASIPNTARVEFGSVSAEVAYAGDPEFEAIEGTSLSYAVNTNDQVIKVGDKYYVLQDGIWFVGDSPEGPFEVAKAVPEAIYSIPPSSPVYNVTYVRVYETEPNAVWYGYTMGYLTGFLAWGVFVYGSGWYHRPWWRPGIRPIFFPRPVTYGIGAFYNPVRGVFGRYGYAYGPYRGIAGGAAFNPRTGTYIRAGAVSGPRGRAGFIAAYNPRTGRGGIIAGGNRNIYGAWKSDGVRRGAEWARARPGAGGAAQARWKAMNRGEQVASLGRRGDVFAGRDGNVYRRQGNQWQRQDGGRWQNVNRPTRENLGDNLGAAIGGGAVGGAVGNAIANRPSAKPNRPNLNRPKGDRPNIGNRPNAGNRPNTGNRPATRPAQRPSNTKNRPAANRKPAQRPAARPATRQNRAPSHLSRDYRGRSAGNRQVNRNRNVQRAPQRQARPNRNAAPRRGGGAPRRGGGRRR